MKRFLYAVCAVCMVCAWVCGQLGAEEYASDGFCAKINKNGWLSDVTYGGKTIFTACQLEGNYKLEPNPDKIDTRFFQAWDYKGQAEISKDGTTTTVKTVSTLGNKQYEQGADYEVTVVLTPQEITYSVRITTKVELKTYMELFRLDFLIPIETVAGRGVQSKSPSRPETLGIVPKEYQKDFSVKSGSSITFSLPGNLLTITADDKSNIGYCDCRAWKEEKIMVNSNYTMKWSRELKTIEPGTVMEWGCKIAMQPESK